MVTIPFDLKTARTAPDARSEVERVYRLMRDWMITTDLPPGSFVSEPEMAERCGTSRTPVREALSRLAQDGWVNSIHRKGFQVRPITLRDISELYTYRRLLERYAGERAAVTATAAHIADLEEIVELEERPNVSKAEMAALNETFHLSIAERTDNERIIGQMRLVMGYLRRLDCLVAVVDQVSHREIVAAIKARDDGRAGFMLSEHVDYALSVMIQSFCQ